MARRLLYVGDIPVEESYQSSVQLYRLLADYPPELLRVIETAQPGREMSPRLPGVTYGTVPIARPELMRGSLARAYRVFLTATAPQHAASALSVMGDFDPEAVLTISSGFGWLVAAELADRLRRPLHLIAHDDWPKWRGPFQAWARTRLARVYRRAQSRLCISPAMIDEFDRRYGLRGRLLYPVRPRECPVHPTAHARHIDATEPIVIAFCGGSGAHVMPGLRMLARAVHGLAARIVIHGPFDSAKQQDLRSINDACEFRGFAAYQEMMGALRQADLLFAPMTFAAAERENMAVSFPSKLADYTAAGVAILMHAPADSAAARWAEEYAPVAHLVDREDPASLRQAIVTLRDDRERRRHLAERGLVVGEGCFSLACGRAVLAEALQ